MRFALPFALVLMLSLLRAAGADELPGPLARDGGCRAAIAVAEREASIPPGLLQAIGRVESGRRDPATGAFGPWPWTLNAEGRGQFFRSREEAIAALRQLQARGVRVIDVGCMQINLLHHPNAFTSLEQAFDPLANARYAARFLRGLQDASPEWLQAAGHYHSHTPDLAATYRARIAAAWPEEARLAGGHPAYVAMSRPPVSLPVANRGGGLAGGTMPSLSHGERGRGIEAYRAAPIPLASRATPRLLGGRGY
ncbi:transglycosylase-like protein with SLT domain [Humitalea rosea]|uniref:Transglycosylase-like protein with SLT domain n=1 Tax=Humitalea rosea TaxID=990373 RepID=A0A2W7IHX6_9PROT|nr:lytic transglycosylase domain-containing protein [Humitalea rosea]PZW38927.1 transglycosylase-like protein with SLT domain [Humitalea rosea]